ncbi:MAG: substrate-binding domain-containing protein, partial [Clostridia bacterium]|nr:substrate-binding domain-containing protein [Clostridia bacterium]
DGEIGFKAADYFMSIGRFRSFGYIPAYTEKEWSVKRGRAFVLRLKRKGHDCRIFSDGNDKNQGLESWLKSLPKPTAIFCAWDKIAADAAYDAGARTLISWAFRGSESNTYKSECCERAWAATCEAFRRVRSRHFDAIREENLKKFN